MKRVDVTFKNGKTASYKTGFSALPVLMCNIGYDFFLRNKDVHKLVKDCLNLERFYSTGINKLPAYVYFGAKITETHIDGRARECKNLPYYSVQHLVNNLS